MKPILRISLFVIALFACDAAFTQCTPVDCLALRATNRNEVIQVRLAGQLDAGTYVLRLSSEQRSSEQRIVVSK